MIDAEKTVFISYRRDVSAFISRAVFMDLRLNGFDTFMDVESIDSGAFDTVILNQIAARAHFVLILTPGSVERCNEAGDWLRREIETAIDLGRNIVPLLVNNFTFKNAESHLSGKLSVLPRYNAMNVPPDFFDEAMTRLRTRFLRQPVSGSIQPTPRIEQVVVQQKIDEAASQPAPDTKQIEAERHFNLGDLRRRVEDYDAAIDEYNAAIQLNPQYAVAYYHRGLTWSLKGDDEAALADYDRAIQLNPDNRGVYMSRAFARTRAGDIDGAIADRDKSQLLDKKQYANAFLKEANSYHLDGDYKKAIIYYTKALEATPNNQSVYILRGGAYYRMSDYERAIQDDSQFIILAPTSPTGYNNRGEAYFAIAQYENALQDFHKVHELEPGSHFALAGLAITHQRLKKPDTAQRLWKLLLGLDSSYADADWVKTELNWAEPLVKAAREIIDRWLQVAAKDEPQ